MNDVLKYVECLKNNTNLKDRTLKNTNKLEVLVAITKLSEKQNKKYLQIYTDWLQEKSFKKPSLKKLKNTQVITRKRLEKTL